MARPFVHAQDGDSGRPLARKAQEVSEPDVERDEDPPLRPADLEKAVVIRSREPLASNRRDVVASSAKLCLEARPEILVELDLHPLRSIATGMNRSWAAAAP